MVLYSLVSEMPGIVAFELFDISLNSSNFGRRLLILRGERVISPFVLGLKLCCHIRGVVSDAT